MASPFSGLFTGNQQATPAAPSSAKGTFTGLFTATPAATAPSAAPISPVQPVSNAGSTDAAPAGSSLPASAFSGTLGNSGYGASNVTDPASGKPLLTYENPEAKASQLLSDRTAPSFDPTVPQKVDPQTLQDPRMKESVSQGIKQSIGGSAFQELDHIMPLELGGSNNKSNLRLEPGQNPGQKYSPSTNPTPTDPIENALADAVHSGTISLVDAWKQMAHSKGIILPEQGGQVPNIDQTRNTKDNLPNVPGEIALTAFPNTTQTLADIQTNPLSLGSSLKDILSTPQADVNNQAEALGTALRNFKTGIQNNAPLSQKISDGLSVLTNGVGFALSPISGFFDAATKVPAVGTVAKLAFNIPFSLAGDAGGDIGMGVLHALPIPEQAKANLAPGVKAIYTLAYQIGLGGKIAPDVLQTLKMQFGARDAQTIATKAEELANERAQVTGQSAIPTAPAETPKPEPQSAITPEPPKPQEVQPAEPPKTVEPQTVKVSRAQLPVGEGDTKTSGLEARMKASLDNLSEDQKANISNYKEMNNKDQLKAAADYVSKNPDDALEVLKGNKPAPKGLLINSIYLALKEQGKGDIDLATKLASLHSTRAGQEIQILRHADPFSPDDYIRTIQDSRIEALGRERVKTMLDKEVSSNGPKLDQAIKSGRAYTKMTLDDFINHITC